MRTWRVASTLLLSLAFVACSDSDDGGGGDGGSDSEAAELTSAEQELADAWSAALQDDEDGFGVAADDADCMGAAIMAEVGGEVFEENDVTAADIGDNEGANSPGEVLGAGVISDAQAGAILDTWQDDCADLADVLSASASSEFELDEDGVACFADGLREDDLARGILLPSFTSDSDDPPEDLLGQIISLLDSCGDGEGGAIVDSIATELSADGTMSEEDAQCIAQAVVDDIGIERLTELGAAGSFEDADPDSQAEITGALITAAGACDVPVSAFGG